MHVGGVQCVYTCRCAGAPDCAD